jgi:hypothetical protein
MGNTQYVCAIYCIPRDIYLYYVPETHIMYFIRRCWFLKCSEEIHYVPIGDGDMWYWDWDVMYTVLGHNVYITSQYWDITYILRPSTSLQMPKIELHRPGIEPGPPRGRRALYLKSYLHCKKSWRKTPPAWPDVTLFIFVCTLYCLPLSVLCSPSPVLCFSSSVLC